MTSIMEKIIIDMKTAIAGVLKNILDARYQSVYKPGSADVIVPVNLIMNYAAKLSDFYGKNFDFTFSSNDVTKYMRGSMIFEDTGHKDTIGYPIFKLNIFMLAASNNRQLLASVITWLGVPENDKRLLRLTGLDDVMLDIL